MKKFAKHFFVLLSVSLLLLAMSVSVFAAGSVTYDGSARKFIFEPGSEYSPTDLFTDFKGVMPGDSITQKVNITNDVSNGVKIKLYMRSLGAHEDSVDFLSELKLTVKQEGKSNLFEAPADQTAQLTEWVYLGTFYSGADIDLSVTLSVPARLGNEYQDAIGELDWQFKVEELPVEESDPKPPKTGDSSNLPLYFTVAGVVGLVFIMLLIGKRRRRTEED